jgi:hypothetical protein
MPEPGDGTMIARGEDSDDQATDELGESIANVAEDLADLSLQIDLMIEELEQRRPDSDLVRQHLARAMNKINAAASDLELADSTWDAL